MTGLPTQAAVRLRHLLEVNPGVRAVADGAEVAFVPMDALGEDGRINLSSLRPAAQVRASYTGFQPNDVVVAKVTPCFENGKTAVVPPLPFGVGYGTTELTVLRAGPSLDARFLGYVMREDGFRQGAIAAMTGAGGLRRVPDDYVRDYQLRLPSLQEQRAVVEYLDRETGRIDELIAKQEQLIGLLNERREALLLDEVQGVGRSGPRRDSGTGWAGSIPQYWNSGNIRHFAAMKTGHTPSRSELDYWIDTSIPWFTLADVWQLRQGAKYISASAELISNLGLQNSAAELLPKGTVVLSRTASVGFTGIMGVPMATSQDYWNWVPSDSLAPEFLWYQLRAMGPYFRSLMHGSTHKTIYQADAAAMRIVVPPLDEQLRIVAGLDRATAAMDSTAARARELVAVLRERRQALISAAVTGTIAVGSR